MKHNILNCLKLSLLISCFLFGEYLLAEPDFESDAIVEDIQDTDESSESSESPYEIPNENIIEEDDINATQIPDLSGTDDLSNSKVSALVRRTDLSDEEKLNFLFLNLTTIHSSVQSGIGYGGDFGYGRSLVHKKYYFGFVTAGIGLIGLLSPGFIFKYGYNVIRDQKFSFGIKALISPVLWTNNWPFLYINEDFHLIYGAKLFTKIKISKNSAFLIHFGIMEVIWPLSNPFANQQWNAQMQWHRWNNQQWANQQFWLGNQIWLGHQSWVRNFNFGIGVHTYF